MLQEFIVRRNICKSYDYVLRSNTYDMDLKCMLALIFANAFEISKFTKLKVVINSCYTAAILCLKVCKI